MVMLTHQRLGIIGAGNMGEALLRGVLHGGLMGADRILVSAKTPERLADLNQRLKVRTTQSNLTVAEFADIVILGIKPQTMNDILTEIRPVLTQNHLLVSIAAGITTQHIEQMCGVDVPVIRVMPNTPALVGEGASAYCRGRFATAEHALATHAILDVVGIAVETTEDRMNPVTAVSGTGPAYIFYTLEAMIQAAQDLGLDPDMARLLVKQTVLGAARLVMDSGEEPDVLRARVTSKGGTTQAAIEYLESHGYKKLVQDAILAACRRADALNRGGS
ncbi:MAG: pyrroline-5-carboxylate reductase [Myxococcales bacterium]|nr:pyrroline-5-carboxylate reductase [Myxococcales bacterium]